MLNQLSSVMALPSDHSEMGPCIVALFNVGVRLVVSCQSTTSEFDGATDQCGILGMAGRTCHGICCEAQALP